jgi:hypothetical protein
MRALTEEKTAMQNDNGLFHLTAGGWIRGDFAPYPRNRVETWKYEMERPYPDAKEIVHLTRIWISPDVPESRLQELRKRYGDALVPTADRHVTLDCKV